jgi:hypothetical protein
MDRQAEAAQQRQLLNAILERVKSDPNAKESIRQDPITFLQHAGLSDEMIGDALREDGVTKRQPDELRFSPEGKSALSRLRPALPCIHECCFTCSCTSGCCLSFER